MAENADAEIVLSEAQRIWDGCQRLKQFPESGRPGRVPMTREVIVHPYIIPYRIKGDCVEILNIFHSPFTELSGMPIQPARARDVQMRIKDMDVLDGTP